MKLELEYNDDTFWLEENTTELVGTGIECPVCGSELVFNDNSYTQNYQIHKIHSVECSNETCNYHDRIRIDDYC